MSFVDRHLDAITRICILLYAIAIASLITGLLNNWPFVILSFLSAFVGSASFGMVPFLIKLITKD